MKDKEILKSIYNNTHLQNEDGEDIPFFCFAQDIINDLELELTEEEVAQLALDNGYSIFKAFAEETIQGGLLLCAEGCSKEPIEHMYDEFYGEIPTIEVWPEEEEKIKESLTEGKIKKKKFKEPKASDSNAKAMWGRTRNKVQKPKKGKSSFTRKKKHKSVSESVSLEEGTSNFATMEKLPLLIWLGYDEFLYDIQMEAEEAVKAELDTDYDDIDELDIQDKVEEKVEELINAADKDIAILDDDSYEQLNYEVEEFNTTFKDKYDDVAGVYVDDKAVVIEAGYYSGAYLFCPKEKEYNDEQISDIDEFLFLMKEKYFLTELELTGSGSDGTSYYKNLGSGKGSEPVEIAPTDDAELVAADELEEELVTLPEEEMEEFRQLLTSNGYVIEKEDKFSGWTSEIDQTHFQIKSNDSNFNGDAFNDEFIRMADLIDGFDQEHSVSITYSFSLIESGQITAGIDVREKWLDPNQMIDLDSGERVSTETSASPRNKKFRVRNESVNEEVADGESIKDFLLRVKKLTGQKNIKIIESFFPLTEAKADVDRFVAWGSKELYDRFMKLKQRLKSPDNDISYWTSAKKPHTPEELITKLDALEQEKTKSQSDAEAKAGADLVAENEFFSVYLIKTFEASKKYGKDSQWCISGSKRWVTGEMQPETYWNNYTKRDKTKFYFFLSKSDSKEKYAFAMYTDGRRQVFNAKDEHMTKSEVNTKLAKAPYVEGVFIPPGHRKPTNLPHLKNARQLGYNFTSLEDYVVDGELALEFRRKTKGTAVVPEEITGLEDLCFAGKAELTEVVIHKGVSYVGVFAFVGCSSLQIKCEAAEKPEGWEEEWNPDNLPVTWGFGATEEAEDDIEDANVVAHI